MNDTKAVLSMDGYGRVLLLKGMRKKLGISRGDIVYAYCDGDSIVIKRYDPKQSQQK